MMKQFRYYLLLSATIWLSTACSEWMEAEALDFDTPAEKSAQYYTNLRAYKASNHEVCFGWFGGWTASGPSMKSRLASLPDSVDIVGLWGNPWHRRLMTEEKASDLKYVREVKGTKVLVTTLLGWTGKELPHIPESDWPQDRQEGLRAYAKALAEEIIDLGFDGLDIDYEPTVGGPADVRDCPMGEDMVVFVEELGKYFGPQSNTGKMLVIDGQIDYMPASLGKYFDYAIAQAYYTTSDYSLQRRYDAIREAFKPEQFIVTEDFESFWRTGGVNFYTEGGDVIPSLFGMALWKPKQGTRKGGFGSYHMEYEYLNKEETYKYLRAAIQLANPAKE